MKVTNKQYAQSLFESAAGKSEAELALVLENFIKVLANNNDLSRVDSIVSEFEKIWQSEEGEISATVTSAKRLDAETLDLLRDYVSTETGAKEVQLNHHVDHKLLSGFVLRFADQVVDGSGIKMIDNFKKELTK